MTHIFRWNGQYAGFQNNGFLFSPQGRYIGWIEDDGSVWSNNGQFFGELVDGDYILKATNRVPPIPRIPRVPPIPPIPLIPPIPRIPRIPRLGWHDPFEV